MTINQYQRLAKAIADKIIDLGSDPNRVHYLKNDDGASFDARDPHQHDDLSITSGDSNATIVVHMMSNPNNPNYKFRTLKPGSISAYNRIYDKNVDLTAYHFDSAQFKKLIDSIKTSNWTIS